MSNSSTNKDIPSKQILLGQFPTPDSIVDFCLNHTEIKTDFVVEPSCGNGIFLDKIRAKYPQISLFGIELDPELADQCKEHVKVGNFYDFTHLDFPTTFIGNPPFKSPAYSLQERKDFVKKLLKKYEITNVREESVIFLVHTVDVILTNKQQGFIHYILPKAIFNNNSKAYLSFKRFLKKYVNLTSVWDLEWDYPGVSRDLVYVSFEIGPQSSTYLHNGNPSNISEFYQELDYIPFQSIFKRTNLGSVPCESILLSIRDEPLDHFKFRIERLFSACNITSYNLLEFLNYKGKLHLKSLQKKEKRKVVCNYIQEIKRLPGYSLSDMDFKPIQHRNEKRWYVYYPLLKKASFVYELNRNPCPSFYFPGNPNKGSTDYFGFCEYDVNRNSSPGANRTVPILGIEDNLCEDFKKWWRENTDLEYSQIFDYILHVSKSKWYKDLKKNCQRFYFGIPKSFLNDYNLGKEKKT